MYHKPTKKKKIETNYNNLRTYNYVNKSPKKNLSDFVLVSDTLSFLDVLLLIRFFESDSLLPYLSSAITFCLLLIVILLSLSRRLE